MFRRRKRSRQEVVDKTKVNNLHTLLALPLDALALHDYLPVVRSGDSAKEVRASSAASYMITGDDESETILGLMSPVEDLLSPSEANASVQEGSLTEFQQGQDSFESLLVVVLLTALFLLRRFFLGPSTSSSASSSRPPTPHKSFSSDKSISSDKSVSSDLQPDSTSISELEDSFFRSPSCTPESSPQSIKAIKELPSAAISDASDHCEKLKLPMCFTATALPDLTSRELFYDSIPSCPPCIPESSRSSRPSFKAIQEVPSAATSDAKEIPEVRKLTTTDFSYQDRVQNLVVQNTFLQTALEEHRATVQHILREMQTQDEHVAKLEHSHNRAIHDLSLQVRALSISTERLKSDQQQQQCGLDDQNEYFVSQLDVLAAHVMDHDSDLIQYKMSQQALTGELAVQVGSLETKVDEVERGQKDLRATAKKEEEKVDGRVAGLSNKLETMTQDLEAHDSRLAEIGQYLNAREDRDQLQIGNIQDQCESLTSKVQALTEGFQCQQIQSTSFQREMRVKEDASAARLDGLKSNLQHQQVLLVSHQNSMESLCASLESRLPDLAQNLQQVVSSMDECQAKQLEHATELQTLQRQCQAQEVQSSSISSKLQEITSELQNQASHQSRLVEQCQSHEKTVVSRFDGIADEVRILTHTHEIERIAIHAQVSELESDVKCRLQDQEAQWTHFQADCQSQLAKSVEATRSIELGLQAQIEQQEKDNKNKIEALAKELQQVTSGLEEHMDDEFRTLRTDFVCKLFDLEKSLRKLDKKQQEVSSSLKESDATYASKTSGLNAEIQKCSAECQDLSVSCCLVKDEVTVLKSKLLKQERLLVKSEEDCKELTSTVQDLSTTSGKVTHKLQDLELEHVDAKKLLLAQVHAVETKLGEAELIIEDIADRTEKQYTGTVQIVETLAERVESQNDLLLEVQESALSRTSQLGRHFEGLEANVKMHDTLHRESLQKVDLRCEALQGKLDTMADGIADTSKELGQVKQDKADILTVLKRQYSDGKVQGCREVNGTEGSGSIVAEDNVVEEVRVASHVGLDNQPLSESEKNCVCLAAKLVAFKMELQRRSDCVTKLEEYVKARSDTFLSRSSLLNDEIELQREQLKRWDATTQKNDARLKETRGRRGHLAATMKQYQEELQCHEERVSDLDAALKDDGISPAMEECLRNKVRAEHEHLDGLKKKTLEIERLFEECETECSKLSAKQGLFADELSRRQRRLGSLRSHLSEMLDLVAVEREEFGMKLLIRRQERDSWKEKTESLRLLLLKTENEWSHLQVMQEPPFSVLFANRQSCGDSPSQPQGKQIGLNGNVNHTSLSSQSDLQARRRRSVDKFTATMRTLTSFSSQSDLQARRRRSVNKFTATMRNLKESLASANEQDGVLENSPSAKSEEAIFTEIEALKSQLETRQKLEEQQESNFLKTKEALESQLEESKAQCEALASKMDRITGDLSARECLAAKVEAVQGELKSRKDQLSRFDQEQSRFKKDIFLHMKSLQNEIRSLEELQLHKSSIVVSAPCADESHNVDVLSAQVESLAAKFADHGDLVARVGALSDAIRRCEHQIAHFDKGNGVADISEMVDYFKCDIEALKKLMQDHLGVKDAHFSCILSKLEKLMNDSHGQGARLETIEAALRDNEEFQVTLTNEIKERTQKTQLQAEHVLQHANEKFLDLATKVDLLANEMQTYGKQNISLARSVKERESLYLSQMNAVREELEARQAEHQQQIQVRIYGAMKLLEQRLAKGHHVPTRFRTWNCNQ